MAIEAARTASGQEPVEEYLCKLESERGKAREVKLADIAIRFEDLAAEGTLEQPRELNHLKDEIWEIKAGVARLPFFYVTDNAHGRVARLTSGFDKRQQRTPLKEIRKAISVRDQDLSWRREEKSG